MGIGLGALRTAWRARRARWAAIGLAATVLGGSVTAYAASRDPSTPSVAATVSAVDRGPVTAEIAATGTAVPAQNRSLGFTVSGTVVRITVQPGEAVARGRRLAAVNDEDARERVARAQDSLDDAEDALAEARNRAGTQARCPTAAVRPVSLVLDARIGTASPSATATPSWSLTPTPTPSATTTMSPPGATTSAPPGSASRSPRSGAGASSTLDGCTSRTGGPDPILGAEQRVNSARRQLAEAKEQLAGTVIRAPFAGRVLSVAGKVGSTVGAGSTFIELADVDGMQVSARFPEADAGRLTVGQTAVVTLPARRTEQFAATVVQVDPVGTANGAMVTYGALLAFTETPGELLVGQSADVRITTAEATDVLRVPATAVHEIQNGSGVVLVRAEAGSERRAVRVGLRGDQHIEITSGLTEGEEVRTSW